MLRIYYADFSALDLGDNYPLSLYRAERMKNIKHKAKLRESLGAELLLNYAARELVPDIVLPLDIVCGGMYGKPALKGGAFEFSISHSGDFAAVAVADAVLGLDIQMQRPCNIELARRFFSRDETAALESSVDADAYFTELWCSKESYIKAQGRGLSAGLNKFSVINMPDIWHDKIGDYHFAVCIPGLDNVSPDIITRIEL